MRNEAVVRSAIAYAKANPSMSVPAVARAHGVPEKAAAAEEKKRARAAALEAKAAEVAAAEAAKAAKAAAELATVMELERKKKRRRPSTARHRLECASLGSPPIDAPAGSAGVLGGPPG